MFAISHATGTRFQELVHPNSSIIRPPRCLRLLASGPTMLQHEFHLFLEKFHIFSAPHLGHLRCDVYLIIFHIYTWETRKYRYSCSESCCGMWRTGNFLVNFRRPWKCYPGWHLAMSPSPAVSTVRAVLEPQVHPGVLTCPVKPPLR